MKKILTLISVSALIISFASCSKKSDNNSENTKAVEQTSTGATPSAKTVAADPFIADVMANDSSIILLPSGLAYKVITEGEGEKPAATSNVTVKYTGMHVDRSIFDSSEGKGVDFNLKQVIPGFSEGIMQMNRGARYELYIPGELGYGERGSHGTIAPNETLIFDVELVDFN